MMIGKRSISFIGIFFLTSAVLFGTKVPFSQAATLHPVAVSIPSINKVIPLISVGVTASNNLDVPHNYVQAGWYDKGPLPGAVGTAVIDGHVDNGGAHPTVAGVFKNLGKLKVGDIIKVSLSDGSVANFKVTGSAVYSYTKFPSSSVFAATNKSLINIITCDGTWLPVARTYSDRLVVTAEKV